MWWCGSLWIGRCWGEGWELDSSVIAQSLDLCPLWKPSESLFPIRRSPSRRGGVEGQEERKILRTSVEKGVRQGDVWASGHRMMCLQMACGIARPAYTTCSSMSAAQALLLRGMRRGLKGWRTEATAAALSSPPWVPNWPPDAVSPRRGGDYWVIIIPSVRGTL